MVVKIKMQKTQKKYVIKRKLKFQDHKNCLEATQLENKINHPEENERDIDSFKEFIKNNTLILKIQQRFKGEMHNVFTEDINKNTLSSIDHKRMQSIDSIETYAYGNSKDLVNEKGEINCNNIIKRSKND